MTGEAKSGKIKTLIIRGKSEEIDARIAAANPLFYDMVPLTLEEIFIGEMEAAGYDYGNILS